MNAMTASSIATSASGYCFTHHLVVVAITNKSSLRGPKAVWLMSRQDAMTFCSDSRTAGNSWMFVFDEIEHYADERTGSISSKKAKPDTGLTDAVISDYGLTVFPLSDSKKILLQRQNDGSPCECLNS